MAGPGGKAVLAIDAGTTGVTCLVLDDALRVQGRSYAEFAQHYPRPGWVEHDAAEIWTTTLAVAKQAVAAAGLAPGDLAAIGVTNQRETTVLWDRRDGDPVAPAIVWQDRRTSERCRAGKADLEPLVRERTGLVLDPYFSATKLEWLLDHVPGARADAEAGRLAFGTIDSWLAWKLTGGRAHVTDPTNASRTLLWDIHVGAWDAELLSAFRVPDTVLPEVVPSAHAGGTTPERLFGAAVPIAGLVGDQQAALFGQRCFEAGQAKNTYGTGCFLLQHTGGAPVASRHGLLTTRAASVDGGARFALEGSVFVAGAAVQWLRDGLRVVASAPETDRLAEEVPDAGSVVVVPAFTGLGAPHWDPDARGAVLGLTRGTDRRHLARAVLESIAFQSAELVAAMQEDSGIRIPELRVDGGATASRPLLQFQADLLQRPVRRPALAETTALGAGMLAGLGVGAWRLADLKAPGGQDTVYTPAMAPDDAAARMATWRSAVAATRAFKPSA